MGIEFDRYAQEGKVFMKNLCQKLGHEGDVAQAGILLRGVLHTLRDRITIAESLNLLSQLPMFLKALYVQDWKYNSRPERFRSLEEFTREVEKEQEKYGETRFDWKESTAELTKRVFGALCQYLSPGEVEDIADQLPSELKVVFEACVTTVKI